MERVFIRKDLTAQATDWMKLFPYTTSEGEDKNFMVPEDERALLYMANSGAIEMNPWNSTILRPDHPDWCMIDLDPSPKNSFEQVIKTAQSHQRSAGRITSARLSQNFRINRHSYLHTVERKIHLR